MMRSSLLNMIERIDWQIVSPGQAWGLAGLKPDELSVGFMPKIFDEFVPIKKVSLRIGKDIIDALEWEKGDKIFVAHNPDDVFHYMLAKSDSGVGFKLATEGKTTVYTLAFTWTHHVKPKTKKSRKIPYEINKKRLLFRIEESSVDE